MIVVVDYGVGNIGAIGNMFDYLGIETRTSADPSEIASAAQIVLPGVGAFDRAMAALREADLVGPLNEAVLARKASVLGVCLGMQLFARRSDEGIEPGLGWIDADVRRMEVEPSSGLKVPNIGWNVIVPERNSRLFDQEDITARFYFDHSYYVACDNSTDVSASIEFAGAKCCAVERGNISGVQFHPEKSHRHGMRLLRRWATKSQP